MAKSRKMKKKKRAIRRMQLQLAQDIKQAWSTNWADTHFPVYLREGIDLTHAAKCQGVDRMLFEPDWMLRIRWADKYYPQHTTWQDKFIVRIMTVCLKLMADLYSFRKSR